MNNIVENEIFVAKIRNLLLLWLNCTAFRQNDKKEVDLNKQVFYWNS